MIPRAKPPSVELREFIAKVRLSAEHGIIPAGWLDLSQEASAALDALLAERAMKPSGTPAMVVRFIAAARQLAAAVEGGHVSENNKAQARNIGVRGKAVADAVDAWTDEGRREPMSGVCEKVGT